MTKASNKTLGKKYVSLKSFIAVIAIMILAFSTILYVQLYKVESSSSNTGSAKFDSGTLRPVSSINENQIFSIPIVSVSSDGVGQVNKLNVRLIPGEGDVLLNTNPYSEPDIEDSLNKAVLVAKEESGIDLNNTDLVYNFDVGNVTLIGGGSAGAAITVNTVAALGDISLRNDAIMTGTINSDGTIGQVAGLVEKEQAAGEAGYKYFLVPEGQSQYTYYDKVFNKKTLGHFTYYQVNYVEKTIDLNQTGMDKWGMEVIEVKNIDDALNFFTSQQ